MFDILIRGGTIVDGTGNVGFKGDITIQRDRIRVLVGDTSSVKAASIVDAAGCILAPGFIDVHSHSDLIALSEPLNDPKILQGVCTEMLGLDGVGYAPLSKKNLQLMTLYYSGLNGYPGLDYCWNSITQYLQQFHRKVSTNVAYFIPNSCLRAETVGWDDRQATGDEIRVMQTAIQQGMAEGALGLSTGLNYPPGAYASTEELIELCRTVARCGGIYVTHVRYDLGDGIFDGFREAISIAARSGCPMHISHYFANAALRGQTARMLKFIDDARTSGIDLTFDAYPWEAGSTSMHRVIPLWAHSGGPYRLLQHLRNKEDRARMKGETNLAREGATMIVSSVKTAKNKWCEGLTVAQIGERLGKDPWDVMCDLMIEEKLAVAYYGFSGDMNDVKVIMNHPAHMFITDGLRIGGMVNPRTYGTYPKILGQLVRDEKAISMEQAIRKITSFPAQRFGLAGRGILQDGLKADIVVFNPITVSNLATYAKPRQFPLGIEYVFLNGKMVVEKGKHTGLTPGEALSMRGYVRE